MAIKNNLWSYAFSATSFSYPIFRSFQEDSLGGVKMFFSDKYYLRSQDMPVALHDAAQFYWGPIDSWLNKPKIYEKYSKPIVIPNWRVQDIDTDEDWIRAEIIFKMINKL